MAIPVKQTVHQEWTRRAVGVGDADGVLNKQAAGKAGSFGTSNLIVADKYAILKVPVGSNHGNVVVKEPGRADRGDLSRVAANWVGVSTKGAIVDSHLVVAATHAFDTGGETFAKSVGEVNRAAAWAHKAHRN